MWKKWLRLWVYLEVSFKERLIFSSQAPILMKFLKKKWLWWEGGWKPPSAFVLCFLYLKHKNILTNMQNTIIYKSIDLAFRLSLDLLHLMLSSARVYFLHLLHWNLAAACLGFWSICCQLCCQQCAPEFQSVSHFRNRIHNENLWNPSLKPKTSNIHCLSSWNGALYSNIPDPMRESNQLHYRKQFAWENCFT